MIYKEFGKTKAKVSALGFGTLRIPKMKSSSDMERYANLIRYGFEQGINYVDTASMQAYGTEELVGRAIKGLRDKVFVATKNHYRGKSPYEWEKLLETSLIRLDTDYIDFYFLHSIKWDDYRKKLVPGKIMERFHKAKDQGIVHHMCFSSHDTPENIIRLIDTDEFEAILVQYNLLDRNNEKVISYANEKGLGVAIMGPVAGGKLANPVNTIKSMIKDVKSMPELSLRFVLSNPNVTLALSGMNTIRMLEENINTASREEQLSFEERKTISEALTEVQKLQDLYCTGCNYCMPCPHGVDIPGNFEAMNYYRVWGMKEYAQSLYLQKKKNLKRKWAEACVGCGICEIKCPQNISIRKQLKETAQALGNAYSYY